MVDTNKLRGIIAERGYSQADIAKALGITGKTFYLKMKKGVFGSDEIQSMIDLLEINNPAGVFFTTCVTSRVTHHHKSSDQQVG